MRRDRHGRRITPPTRADLDTVASPLAVPAAREGVDRIGAVNQLRSLQRALRPGLVRPASPYRQGSTVLARLLTLFVVAALVLGAIPGEDTGAIQAAAPSPTARPTVGSGVVRPAAVAGLFVTGTIWEDTRIRNGFFDDNEVALPV